MLFLYYYCAFGAFCTFAYADKAPILEMFQLILFFFFENGIVIVR